MFVVTGLCCLVTYLPISIYFNLHVYRKALYDASNVALGLVVAISTFNFSMEFYLYVVSGPLFREFLVMIKCKGSDDVNKFIHLINTNNWYGSDAFIMKII